MISARSVQGVTSWLPALISTSIFTYIRRGLQGPFDIFDD